MKPLVTKREFNLVTSTFFVCLLIVIGGVMNFYAVAGNGGRMPVDYYKYEGSINTSSHFDYKNPSDIKYSFLSDRFNFFSLVFSVGDFILALAFLGIVSFSIFLLIGRRNYRRLYGNE